MKNFSKLIFFFFIFTFSIYSKDEFTLNFNNVDIKTFIKFVSEFTEENYVLDPQIKGNITIYSQKPVSSQDINKIFEAILNLYGYTVVKKEKISLIIPISDAKIRSGEINIGKVPEEKKESFINQIIPLKYYSAATLSQILSPYLTKGGQITVDERTNSLIISDIGGNIGKIMEIIEKIDVPTPPGKEEFRVYRLENATSEDMAKILGQILSARKQTQVPSRTPGKTVSEIQPSVVSAKNTNSLIIYANPDDFPTIEKLIKELDIMTNQVLIEALIAEVTYEKTKQIGIEWVDSGTIKDDYTGVAGTNFETLQTYITSGIPPTGLSLAAYKGELTLPLSVGALINLYGKDSRFNILSTPQIMTSDNQEASINISENIPYLKETRFVSGTTGTTSDVIKSYDYKDVGIVLKITPQISQDKYVKLKLSQEVTKLIEGGNPEAPTTAKRLAETTLIVPNNKTIVLGGLMRNDAEKTIHKVPFLGDIPLLGKLFQKQSTSNIKTNLLIFITPHIVSNFEEAEKIKEEKEKILKELQK